MVDSPSFNSAMSFVWFEKLGWTITLLTRMYFLIEKLKKAMFKEHLKLGGKLKRAMFKKHLTFQPLCACLDHEVQ